MGSSSLLAHLSRGKNHNPQGNVFNNVWSEYEDVILHSLVTSFGLDFLVADQNGGDVDTLRSVRDGHYKNASNREAYEARETYDGVAYHSDKRYKETIRTERTRFQDTGVMHDDRVAIETAKTEGKIAMETVSKTHMRLPKMFG